MENLGTRPTEFVISRSPQMLQLSNQIIWLVPTDMTITVAVKILLSRKCCVRTTKMGALLAIALAEIARSSAGRRKAAPRF
ncbi:hypothetical protein [Mesorhizobium sp. L48C026A00]|uniref:hypothetical protein n=1 Tax=Mesorhizobium sp. L48C026A00 TaxID=1287182 RepID=UPI0012EB8BAB|nr:hypothetical protein [Mesorhizobium sp. L48C026A00]